MSVIRRVNTCREIAAELSERAEKGEVLSVLVIFADASGDFSSRWSCDDGTPIVRMVGEMEFTKRDIVEAASSEPAESANG